MNPYPSFVFFFSSHFLQLHIDVACICFRFLIMQCHFSMENRKSDFSLTNMLLLDSISITRIKLTKVTHLLTEFQAIWSSVVGRDCSYSCDKSRTSQPGMSFLHFHLLLIFLRPFEFFSDLCHSNLFLQTVIHPLQDRVLSVRENARIQGFPDFYKLCGPIKEK